MVIYTAVYDMNFNFLIAQKRPQLNSWWSRETFPTCNLVNVDGEFCLPAALKSPSETIIDAGERVLKDKGGRDLPMLHHCTRTFVKDGYALVCFVVAQLKPFQKSINDGLAPRQLKPHLPNNAHIKDWEMERFVIVEKCMLDQFLGKTKPRDESVIWTVDKTPVEKDGSIQRYKELIGLLKTIT